MRKSSTLSSPFSPTFLPTLLASLTAFALGACAGGETTGGGGSSGTGNTGAGSGGRTIPGSGGATTPGSGGATTPGSGGAVSGTGGRATGSGGIGPGTGGRVNTGSGGTTTTGSGGSGTGSGGSGTGSGGSTMSGTCNTASTIAMNGWGMSGTWKGYAYTFGGSTATISPTCPTPCFMSAGTNLCASGTLGPDTTYASVAGVGWNVNQAMMTPNPEMTVATTGSGIAVNVAGGTANLRVSIKNDTTEWCAPLPAGGSGTVPWAMFNTKCWDGSGTAFTAGTAISKVQIVLPSDAAMSRPFCICLVSAGPG